jgi:hypothetical protein
MKNSFVQQQVKGNPKERNLRIRKEFPIPMLTPVKNSLIAYKKRVKGKINSQTKALILRRPDFPYNVKGEQYIIEYYGCFDHFKQDLLPRIREGFSEYPIWESPKELKTQEQIPYINVVTDLNEQETKNLLLSIFN